MTDEQLEAIAAYTAGDLSDAESADVAALIAANPAARALADRLSSVDAQLKTLPTLPLRGAFERHLSQVLSVTVRDAYTTANPPEHVEDAKPASEVLAPKSSKFSVNPFALAAGFILVVGAGAVFTGPLRDLMSGATTPISSAVSDEAGINRMAMDDLEERESAGDSAEMAQPEAPDDAFDGGANISDSLPLTDGPDESLNAEPSEPEQSPEDDPGQAAAAEAAPAAPPAEPQALRQRTSADYADADAIAQLVTRGRAAGFETLSRSEAEDRQAGWAAALRPTDRRFDADDVTCVDAVRARSADGIFVVGLDEAFEGNTVVEAFLLLGFDGSDTTLFVVVVNAASCQ